MRVDKIIIESFKKIENVTIDLNTITALVGGNTSGKSSALQAIQLCISLLQAAYLGKKGRDKRPTFYTTLSDDDVYFRPTQKLLDLRHGSPATQQIGYSIEFNCSEDTDDNDTRIGSFCKLHIKRGKNANLALDIDGNLDLASILASRSTPFAIFTPGLSGIPLREEWRTRGALDAGAMHGDANLYLRSVLDHLLNDDLDTADRLEQVRMWTEKCDITELPDSSWRMFCSLLDRCYPGARVYVDHNPQTSKYIDVRVSVNGHDMPLDMASTGMLQVIQILAYACFYKPPLLILDEPDAHLHADSQSRLYEALRGLATETNTRIILASHSPQLIQSLTYDIDANILWMDEGKKVDLSSSGNPAIPLLMSLGALHLGNEIFSPHKTTILLTEDKLASAAGVLASANGAGKNLAITSYNGCGNLSGARMLARILRDMRPEVKVIIHRDRDYRTSSELKFEYLLFEEWKKSEGVDGIEEIFTSYNDIEHIFTSIDHINEIFGDKLTRNRIDEIVNEAIAEARDNMVRAIVIARNVIENRTYSTERLRKKPIWAESGMTDKPPKIESFLPARGTDPFPHESCHGKELARRVVKKLHNALGGDIEHVRRNLYSPSASLADPRWAHQFD